MNDLNLFKKNGFLVKENLISKSKINKINKIVNEVISKEKKRKKGNGTNGTCLLYTSPSPRDRG